MSSQRHKLERERSLGRIPPEAPAEANPAPVKRKVKAEEPAPAPEAPAEEPSA